MRPPSALESPRAQVQQIEGRHWRGMLDDFGIEIGTSFGRLRGRIWRIGTMGYNARKDCVLLCLAALEATLRRQGRKLAAGAAVDAALAGFRAAEEAGGPAEGQRAAAGGSTPGDD